uniref:hypothetical protein n=1 Tax=Enterocloster clostridioformis TaxID=1531 RepID=UPI0025A55EB4|nr:hypothetical protein [Enterocloster clostridioformis]
MNSVTSVAHFSLGPAALKSLFSLLSAVVSGLDGWYFFWYNYVKSSPLNYVDPSGNWPETESHIVRTDHVPVADWSNATRTSNAPERPSLDDWLSEMAVKLAVSSKKRQMERELEKNMKAAQAASQSTSCSEAVVVADSVLSFLMSMTLGAVGAVIENGTAIVQLPKNFVQDVTGQARDKTMLDLMRDLSTNSLGFEIGRLIGDLASIMIGYHTTLLGLGTLVASGATGQIQVTPAGIVIVAEGVAITISGALDTADALGAVEVELSKATSPGGSRLGNEDEGDSYTGGRTQQELDNLARDPSHGNKITNQGIKEREVGLDLWGGGGSGE